jgi:hypothetical protein
MSEGSYKLWGNPDGHLYNEDAPIIESETYFPFLDNPLVVFTALQNKRHEWDMDKN